MCPVWTTRGQRLVFKCLEGWEFRRESGVPMVGSSGMRREFRQLKLQLSYLIFKYAEGREFRRESGVPIVGSSGIYREFRRLTLML